MIDARLRTPTAADSRCPGIDAGGVDSSDRSANSSDRSNSSRRRAQTMFTPVAQPLPCGESVGIPLDLLDGGLLLRPAGEGQSEHLRLAG